MSSRHQVTRRRFVQGTAAAVAGLAVAQTAPAAEPVFRAGAALVDVIPPKFPVIVNGYTFERMANRAIDRLAARALVLDDGQCQAAICVVDTCVMPRGLIDQAKELAHRGTGVPVERMLVSATHTHSAPSVLEALGSRVDQDYAAFLPGRIAAAIEEAWRNREPARVGWTVVQDPNDTHCRLWILQPGKVPPTSYEEPGKRILMCPPYEGPANIGPAGAVDAGLTLLALQALDGRPLALLANYAMHFYGAEPLSADWCGQFDRQVQEAIGPADAKRPFVAIMSQGTSGDQHWMDFSRPARKGNHIDYAAAVVKVAREAFQRIEYRPWAPLAMAERRLTLGVRPIPEPRLKWAREVVAKMGDRPPKTRQEVYAREQLLLAKTPSTRELKLQALRVGELGITAIPCEVYGITGLKLKTHSPLPLTMNLELANGEEGYIPPPEQHSLGGYSTWEARTACLEVQAEPKIVDALLGLLEDVSNNSRRALEDPPTLYSQAVLASKPLAYWRLQEMHGPAARDALGRTAGRYENGIAFYLDGFSSPIRAAHFAGGRMVAPLPALGSAYSVELWFWNGLPADFRDVTGWIFSHGTPDANGDHLGIGGKSTAGGRLLFSSGPSTARPLFGRTPLALRTWYHLVLVRDGKNLTIYLNGDPRPEIAGQSNTSLSPRGGKLFLGGRADGLDSLEGKLCEAALYDRPLTAAEAAAHYQAARTGWPR